MESLFDKRKSVGTQFGLKACTEQNFVSEKHENIFCHFSFCNTHTPSVNFRRAVILSLRLLNEALCHFAPLRVPRAVVTTGIIIIGTPRSER